ncbi:oligosaccharide flippase family protein [uncultured Clostridium sp.]|uniref:oligosaccharide flippase family protein n=1 Tax=uncultured Clostridium sp. TaxID=59620 RepID=UPI002596D66B|nr:oligosaccharide flippase family protein [uncultured Clostridium sp.]
MRTKYAIKNISISIFSQIVITLLGFASRKVFVDSLGAEYLGVNGLLSNVLSMMVLIESGIGISIVYNLYKPLADNNKEKIIALVQLYKKAYTALAIIMLVISSVLYPFMGYLMKTDTDIPGIFIVYFIFVGKNIISYMNAYKWALINADQKGYVLSTSNLVFQILTTIGKILILMITKNYIAYLLIEVAIFVIQNVVNTIIVYNRYPYIKNKSKYKIDLDTKDNINKNVKAMFFHNIGGYLVSSTDNILISAFVGLKAVGLYSNYTMVISQLSNLLSPIINGIGASVGNLIVTEDNNKTYSIFRVSFMISFWIYSFATIILYNLLDPFIGWMFGTEYILSKSVVLVVLLNFYLNGMRGPIATFKNKAGLFVQDKYISVIEGLVNLFGSLILIKYFGFIGVFLGTTLSTLVTVFWSQPRVVYKYLFKRTVISYFIKYVIGIVVMLLVGGVTTFICNLVATEITFISLIIRGLICLITVNSIYLLIFFRTPEIKYLITSLKVQFNLIREKVSTRESVI